ncbi:keratinocyte-associated protein 2 [Arachis ipaensis]|uniref:keratinocyte-associated protein 2 n=1 Tax=Arachis ipaensis TaxID=130454 RepID=UPI0007AF58BA|nr:keratinocyte-associated protein 2 [Arachis ipaensis]XP_025667041.1 keratinocyte-associated protein 2 [Arachis hypogaea]
MRVLRDLNSELKPLLLISVEAMAGSGSSMLYSFLMFTVILSLQEMYRAKLASTELYTILGGFISSLLFLVLLTFIGNYQETVGAKTGWGAVFIAEAVALIAASTVHRVCITTCFLFSAVLLYEVNKISGSVLSVQTSDSRSKKYSGRG